MTSKATTSSFLTSLPELPADNEPTTYPEAVAVTSTTESPGILRGDLKRDWCIGQVPAGGYLMSVIASGTQHYFTTHHPSRQQRDLITMHAEFLGRSTIGPCTLHITDLKLGRQFSTVRVQLRQETGLCIEALVTQGNLAAEARSGGLSLPTLPVVEKRGLPRLEACVERRDAVEMFRRRTAFAKTVFMLEEGTGQLQGHPRLGPSVREQWVRFRGPVGGVVGGEEQGFSLSSLPYLCDNFRPLVEAYGEEGNWFPTMCCSLEVKKRPPTERGWEWLFIRVEAKVIRDGRNDLDVVILDAEGEVVALAKHTALVVSVTRNLKTKGAKM